MLIQKHFDQLRNMYNDIDSLINLFTIPSLSIRRGMKPKISHYYAPPDKYFKESFEEAFSSLAPVLQPLTPSILTSIALYLEADGGTSRILHLLPGSIQVNNKWVKVNIRAFVDSNQHRYLIISLWKHAVPSLKELDQYPVLIKENNTPQHCPELAIDIRQYLNLEPWFANLTNSQKKILSLSHTFTNKEIATYLGLSEDTVKDYSKGITSEMSENLGIQFRSKEECSLFLIKLGFIENSLKVTPYSNL